MQNNTIVRIALCGFLAFADITVAMDVTTQVNKNTTPLYNGYYTNNFDSLPPQLPMYEYLKEQNLPKNANASEITYTNTTNGKTNTVQFSGKNKSNELLIYNQEKYHVIIDSKGKDLFCIKMHDTPSPTSSNNSPISLSPTLSPRNNNLSNQNNSVSPIDDYDCTRTPSGSLSNSQSNSPRNKQLIKEVLGGEKEIIYEVVPEDILDNTGRTYQQPTPPSRDTIVGFFTNEIYSNPIIYNLVERRHLSENCYEITYQIDSEKCKKITINSETQYNKQRYIIVNENVMGLIKLYVIDMNPEAIPTNQHDEQSDNSTDSLIGPEKTPSEQIIETNNNNNEKEEVSSNLPISGKLTESQTHLSCFSRMPYNFMSDEYKQYDGKITESNKQTSKIAFTDKNNIDQEVWVSGAAEGATFAIIKNSNNKVVCVVKLPTPKNVINTDSQSDFQRFNKNPNNRDPKYTVIGAAFLTICIALAYKYDKLPTVLTKLFDGCFAQLHKLTPNYFKH